jgi:hypothetical protein
MTLEPLAPAPPPVAPPLEDPPQTARGGQAARVLFWTSLVATGAGVAAFTVTGLKVRSIEKEQESAIARFDYMANGVQFPNDACREAANDGNQDLVDICDRGRNMATLIGGTIWNGTDLGFDIVALRYAACGDHVWTLDPPYNNSSIDGDDVCTAMTGNGTGGPAPGLFLYGYTPNADPVPGNTDYVILGIDVDEGVLSSSWQSTGFGDGVRMWNPGQGASDDRSTAAISTKALVVTGHAGNSSTDGGPYDVATIVYYFTNGGVAGSHTYGAAGANGIDLRAAAMGEGHDDLDPVVYITGSFHSPNSDPPMNYMTIKYQLAPIAITAYAFFPSPDGLEARGRNLVVIDSVAVYVTGRNAVEATGPDHVTLRYSP